MSSSRVKTREALNEPRSQVRGPCNENTELKKGRSEGEWDVRVLLRPVNEYPRTNKWQQSHRACTKKSNTKSTATFFLVGMGEISRTSHRTRATPGRLLSKGNGGCSQSSFGSPSEMVVSTRSVVAAQTKRWTSPLTYQENNTHRSCTEVPVEAADIQLQNARLYSGTISSNC